MKNLGLLMMVAFTLFVASCGKQETSAANTNSSAVNSTKNGNANQTSEQVSAPKGLKPSEPCGWFEESSGLKAREYKQSEVVPGSYSCFQTNYLETTSLYTYVPKGNAETINEFSTSVKVSGLFNAKQKEKLHNVLALTAMEIADRASGNKLSEEILGAILSGDTKKFTLEPGADSTKPQLKTVSVENTPGIGKSYEMEVTLKF